MANASLPRTRDEDRPLSPHLGVYRPTITMVMSIMHRITGVALYLGTLLLVWWLIAAATGPAYYTWVSGIMGSIPGKVILFGYTWALLHHMMGGIRHLIWDTGRGLDIPSANRLCWTSIVLSVGLTLTLWAFGLSFSLAGPFITPGR